MTTKKSISTAEFVEECKKQNKMENLDYSKVVYSTQKEKVTATCAIHGDFSRTAMSLKKALIPCIKCRKTFQVSKKEKEPPKVSIPQYQRIGVYSKGSQTPMFVVTMADNSEEKVMNFVKLYGIDLPKSFEIRPVTSATDYVSWSFGRAKLHSKNFVEEELAA